MTTRGRMYGVDSKTAPLPPAPPPTDDEIEGAIDLIVAKSIRLAARVQQLEAVIDALLMAIDSRGEGFAIAVGEARKVRRGE